MPVPPGRPRDQRQPRRRCARTPAVESTLLSTPGAAVAISPAIPARTSPPGDGVAGTAACAARAPSGGGCGRGGLAIPGPTPRERNDCRSGNTYNAGVTSTGRESTPHTPAPDRPRSGIGQPGLWRQRDPLRARLRTRRGVAAPPTRRAQILLTADTSSVRATSTSRRPRTHSQHHP